MSLSNRDYDLADRLIEHERSAGVARATKSLSRSGNANCAQCGDLIPQARREALSSATRCAECQNNFERGKL